MVGSGPLAIVKAVRDKGVTPPLSGMGPGGCGGSFRIALMPAPHFGQTAADIKLGLQGAGVSALQSQSARV